MADVTLSKAVRSNLLSLQNTSSLLAKTQERLATGLKVNSALDNPTNFFTASSLNSRANDLGRLLDSISNANQTIEAADNGLTAITKLVESAQATARQALQTSATVETTAAAAAGTATSTGFSALDVSGAASSADAGTLAGGAFTALDVSQTATAATTTGTGFSSLDVSSGSVSFDLETDGSGSPTSITIDAGAVSTYNTNNGTSLNNAALSAQDVADIINEQFGSSVASVTGGELTLTSTTTGSSSDVVITNFADTANAGSTGLANVDATNGVDADSLSFDLTIDGAGSPTTITIDAATVSTYNTNNGASLDASNLSAADVATLINDQAGASVASVNGTSGGIDITSTTTGSSSDVTIANISESVSSGASGLANGTDSGADAVAADSVTFSVTLDSGSAQNITIDAATVSTYNTNNGTSLDASALSAQNVADLINDQLSGTATTASVTTGGELTLTSATTGTSSAVAIGTVTSNVSGGSVGTFASTAGTAATTTTVTNPKRDEFVETYNDLLTQIDDLAKDAGFNGVNLLSGDDLSVLFNEDGSSNLDITGVTFDSAGLSLSAVASGGFDSNAAINTTLDSLGDAIDSLRAQASKFGSNLSVVETRQNFTKETINTLETGAANLTLADSNEEAANLLALQTRQQLSSTSLSLASQADQQVLRLF
ncbi:flagellin [Tepidamorphus sp. 3E244]|uniref:flagellin N-terminal helical domain-containing protein n=1 Tax=Tepidamorphus sp. 3E244 TaxID=3385498 RepID=UPI0038FCB62D